MKATLFLAVAGLAAAQIDNIPEIPQCAVSYPGNATSSCAYIWKANTSPQYKCLAKGLGDVGCDDVTDFKCICEGLDKIMESQSECFTDSCDTTELENAQKQAASLCKSVVSGSMTIPEATATGTTTSGETTASGTTDITTSATTGVTTGVTTPTPSGTETSGGASPTETGGNGDGGDGGSGGGDGDGDGGDGGDGSDGSDGDGGDGGDGDDAARPAIGLAAAALAVLAAL